MCSIPVKVRIDMIHALYRSLGSLRAWVTVIMGAASPGRHLPGALTGGSHRSLSGPHSLPGGAASSSLSYRKHTLRVLALLAAAALGLWLLLPGGALHAQSGETIEFAEHTPVTTPVAVFTATDDEDDKAGEAVEWSLTVGDDLFDISQAGVLTFEESPDYENLPSGGTGTNSDMYAVTVTATDSDDGATNYPIVVQVTNVNEPATLTLSNRQPVDGVEITATLTDEDSPDNSALTSLVWKWARSSSPSGPFTDIEATTSNPTNSGNTSVYTPGPSDVNRYLRVTVTYADPAGSGREESEVSGQVSNSRSSNAAPVIVNSDDEAIDSATLTVDENSAAGTPVGAAIRVSNAERDVLTFKLSGTDAGKFVIDSSGQITVGDGTELDTEDNTKTGYSVTVTVEDGNFEDSLTAADFSDSITVTINAKNVEEAPELKGKTSVDHEENTPIATAVATYTVTDDEDDASATLNTRVVHSGADEDAFTLTSPSAGTWALAFKAAPDFEAPADAGRDNTYNVTITATDSSDRTDVLNVAVMVTNVKEDGTVELSTLAPKVGVELTATLTGDKDGATSGITWKWERSSASSADAFDTDPSTVTEIEGATSASYTPVHADTGNFLRATATYTDPQGSDSASMVTNAAVLTTNRAPWFDDPSTDADESMVERNVNEGENTSATNVGAAVTATDPESASLTYRLSGDAAPFSIDRATAQISVRAGQTLDTETKDEYVVTVTATDPDGLSAAATVTIEITNVPESPVITRGGLAIGGPASLRPAEGVTGALATYTLAGPNAASGTWTFGGDDAGDFTFVNGVLSFRATPDYEDPTDADGDNVYEVTLSANDGTYDAMRAVTITVTNVDEDGELTLSSATPAVDVPLTATLEDPDEVVDASVEWQWAREQSDGSYADIATATSDTYTPVAADQGKRLRVTVTYTDGHGAGKSLPPEITNAVVAGDPLCVRYDVTPKNGAIDRAEVAQGIEDLLFGTGSEALSRPDLIRPIEYFIFEEYCS
jgi:hypothetical protein